MPRPRGEGTVAAILFPTVVIFGHGVFLLLLSKLPQRIGLRFVDVTMGWCGRNLCLGSSKFLRRRHDAMILNF